MLTMMEPPVQQLPYSQAMELSQLVDLEARWENLRIHQSAAAGPPSTLKELHQKQKAYEAKRAERRKLVGIVDTNF